MITRRKAVLGISAAALGSAALPALGLLEPPQNLPFTARPSPGADTGTEAIDNRLSRDIARMAFRADSEEGVPVLLACINQVVDKRTNKIPPTKLKPWNAQIAAELRQDAAAWQRIRPNCPASDVAHLVQIVAERDLSTGGMGHGA